MWIVRLALRRPYTFAVAALVLLLLTPLVLLRTPTDIFPEVNIPVISVVWTYNGLNAREMEERIIYSHERMISTVVNDIEHIESTAYNGAGVIKVFLQPGASVSDGVAQITASGQTILRFLPPGITPPFIIRYNASSVPIFQYSLASTKYSEQELQDMAINRVKIGLSTVRGASFFPVEQLDSEYRPVGGRPGQTYDTFTLPFDLSYEFDLWGRVRRIVESATAQMQAVADDVESVRLAVQAEVAANYFAIRTLDSDRALLLSSIDIFGKSLELVRSRRAGGMVSDLDVAQAETVLKNTEALLPDNALQRAKFEHALAVLTRKNASLFRVSEKTLQLKPLVIPSDLPSELLERRPDIAAVERHMAAANANVGVATAAFFPTIRLGAQWGFQTGDLNANRNASNLFVLPMSQFWAVGTSATLPLFQGGQLIAGLNQAKASYEETVARYRQTVLSAFADVENNLAAEHLLASKHEKVVTASKAAHRQLEIANNRYGAGLVTYLDVAVAENTSLGIERSAMRLRGQQLVAVVSLIKSLGGGWRRAN
jgi:multidrug efflux system outer membrane protein